MGDFKQGITLTSLDIWAVKNNAAVNIHIHSCVFMCSFMWTYVFISLGNIFRSGIAGSFGNSVSHFKELPDCSPKWFLSFYSPTSSVGGSQFLHIFADICYCLSF